MKRRWLAILLAMAGGSTLRAQPTYQDIDLPPHNYRQRALHDRFTRLKNDLESARVVLNQAGEKEFLASLLQALEIPATSQMLVFSTTSLQLSLISPRNPRAIYFNEDAYVGYIPGGRIEIVSLDPELGGIFHIFDIPRDGRPVRAERSERCMNCHAGADTGHVPGLLVKSVVPGPTGGSLDAFRLEESGHGIPFDQRFGGWYVTGQHSITNHWGNIMGRLSAGTLTKTRLEPGKLFDFGRYLVPTSDVLPQLLFEHQVGFVNRVVEAAYRARTHWHADNGTLTALHGRELDQQANLLTRYLLFADEATLPAGGVTGDAAFKTDFLRHSRRSSSGASLRDLDLDTRLFKHRGSYMIYSPVFAGLPPALKQRVYQRLAQALSEAKPDPEYAYLPAAEKRAIHTILKQTLADLPRGW